MVIATLAGLVLLAGLAALVVLATAATVWLVKTRPALEQDPDTRFWYGFAGLCVLVPAVLLTAVANRWAGAALTLAAAGTWFWANRLVSRRMAVRAADAARSRQAAEHAALAARHDVVLTRWSRYSLDPAAAIDFPAMNDVRIPETSALVKAVALAEELRRAPTPTDAAAVATANGSPAATDTPAGPDYREAIASLEAAFRRAEQAAAAAAP
ncbi:hypothetical protein AB4Y80_15600 [Specibacter sp. RAF43]